MLDWSTLISNPGDSMKIRSAAGGPGGCHVCVGDRDGDPLCCRLLEARSRTGHPSLVAGLSRVWGPPCHGNNPQPCLALAAVKESSPCEWWELPWLRSRSTSAPLREPPPQLWLQSPPHRSTWRPRCPPPHPPPLSGCQKGTPLGRGSGGLYHVAESPARGSRPLTGPDDSCAGALSQKAGGAC